MSNSINNTVNNANMKKAKRVHVPTARQSANKTDKAQISNPSQVLKRVLFYANYSTAKAESIAKAKGETFTRVYDSEMMEQKKDVLLMLSKDKLSPKDLTMKNFITGSKIAKRTQVETVTFYTLTLCIKYAVHGKPVKKAKTVSEAVSVAA